MKNWKKLTSGQQIDKVRLALQENVSFTEGGPLGYPVSKLDGRVFNEDASFLKDAPVLMTFVANPNHIGCHTTGPSESAFKGTQQMEREVLEIVAVEIFKAQKNQYDGYMASGGTEANIQALWMYRNFFVNTHKATNAEIMIVASEDTHYSIDKGSNILCIDRMKVPVDFETRKIQQDAFEALLRQAIKEGKKYFIVVANMGTTMFGSVDDPDTYTHLLEQYNLPYKLHIDAAYGGFVYPFIAPKSNLDFSNPNVSSITIDAHKMLQAPYGSGLFLCRKNLIENVLTKEAEYVEGMDLTLSGSRSGANAVAVWMILTTYGANGWFEKVKILQMRTDWLCRELDTLQIGYFREFYMNIVTLKAEFIPKALASKYDLVPQKHDSTYNQWYKIVLMDHVEVESLGQLIDDLKRSVAAII